MSTVLFKRADYEYHTLKPIMYQMIDALGADLIQPRMRVLIKPNLLLAAGPEKAVVTHPLVARIAAEYVLDRDAYPMIADSPPLGSFEKILKECGYSDLFKDLDVEFKSFETSAKIDIGEPFGSIDLAADALEADLIINLAKLKTHSQMLLTLGVKNLFGCVVGYKKPEWHVRAGIDRTIFARLLVQIYRALNPAITIVDGILAMEGQGPGKSGKPRQLDVLIGCRDAFEADRAICQMLNMDPDTLLTNRVAKELGLVPETAYIQGDFHMINDFMLPDLGPLMFGPAFLQKLMRKHFIQRPVVKNQLCSHCGECRHYCPATAINSQVDRITFNYDRCIRCYCCIEICPQGALSAKETLPGKIIRQMTDLR